MKFAKVLQQTLDEDDIPTEWLEAAIQYKTLKKCITNVVKELQFLGLEKNTLKLLLEDSNSKVVELGEDETTPTNPIIAEYTLTKSSEGGSEIRPMLKITLDFSNENYTDDHIYELGLELKHKIESFLNDEEIQHDQEILELTNINDELRVISPRSSISSESSLAIPDADQTEQNLRDLSLEKKPRKNEIFIILNSDAKFFRMLNEELEKLDELKKVEEAKLIQEIQKVGEIVQSLAKTTGVLKSSDMYKWRELFKIYLDSEVYFKYNETSISSSERNSTQIKANMAFFMSNVEKSGILTQFKNKKSLYAFNQFVSANYHLLKILQFQSINTQAFLKILKKFDKRTSLGIKYTFPKLVSNDHIFITGSSLAQSICYVMQTSVLTLIPQLDDYTCLICTSVAFKPIRLLCSHMFCVRCLVKLKQQNKNNCPICRSPDAILNADGSNLDLETMALMKRYFPVEVKEKIREREQERYDEIVGKQPGGKTSKDKCEIV